MMYSTSAIRISCEAYTVGWICVLEDEHDAARALLDEEYATPSTQDDQNTYLVGRMGRHNVVIVRVIDTGSTPAAELVTNMTRTFRNLRFGLMVGTGGGATDAPRPGGLTTDILLGDVVVSRPNGSHGGVIEYDRGRQMPGDFEIISRLNSPGTLLASAAAQVAQNHRFKKGNMARYIREAQSRFHALDINYFNFPGREHDLLFAPGYDHFDELGTDCSCCDRSQLVTRTSTRKGPAIHNGLIASADVLMQDPHTRDTMRQTHGALCFEMESAGMMNSLPCLIIRGIANYADSHKNDLWQPYAALTAAAYAKDLLALIQPQEVRGMRVAVSVLLYD
ncbi:nucleoside phosphorylase domain-containing protein [Aspergillus granulosus]|uniref:Nucleoside phosphorylase domain-containing protein n=1 Tax=Aspergillus granulosus TaxID=176169 RepID=A0ABR4HYA3_9EURO